MEGILDAMSDIVDLGLSPGTAGYLLDTRYANDYLHSPMAGTAMMSSLLDLIAEITNADDELVMVPLPLNGPRMEVETAGSQFVRFLYGKGADLLAARRNDIDYFMDGFQYDPFRRFPLLFVHIAELRALLMSSEDAVRSLLNTNVLLAPIGLEWLLLFDFDMDMLQLMALPPAQQRAKGHHYFMTQQKR